MFNSRGKYLEFMMRRKAMMWSLLAFSISLTAFGQTVAAGAFKAGAAKVDVTPTAAELPKQYLGVLDKVYARAIVRRQRPDPGRFGLHRYRSRAQRSLEERERARREGTRNPSGQRIDHGHAYAQRSLRVSPGKARPRGGPSFVRRMPTRCSSR